MTSSVGLVGCGNMGAAIATRLSDQVDLAVFDVDEKRRQAVAAETGATAASSVAELGRSTDVVILSLPNAAISGAVLAELIPALRNGAVVIETSTVSPSDVATAEALCRDAGIRLVDAAILSGVAQMAAGTTTLLVGGHDDAVAAAQPVLDAIAPDQMRLGPPGTGMAAKVGNNAVSHAVMVVLAEAFSMVGAAGVPLSVFGELLARPDAGLIRPLTHRMLERVAEGDYEGGMPTEAARKDSVLALQLAQRYGVPLFAIQAAHVPYEIAIAQGLARDDYAAIAKLWEQWTGRSFSEGDPSAELDESA